MCYLPKYLENEIRKKADLVRNSSLKCVHKLICKRLIENSIKKNAQIHSYRIEHPFSHIPHSIPTTKRDIRKGIKNLENAFRWGEKHFNPETFDESFVRKIAAKISPKVWRDIAEYRRVTQGVTISGSSYAPPYPQKMIDVEIPFFEKTVKEKFSSDDNDPVKQILSAAYMHFHLVRIHPFEDGNGRTARTMQNIILNYYGLPPPVIESGERETYYRCLEEAVGDWKDKGGIDAAKSATKGEGLFYSFIAGKVNASLDKVLSCD